jgi:hypothetical protein
VVAIAQSPRLDIRYIRKSGLSRSLSDGRRLVPMTLSISALALLNTSGFCMRLRIPTKVVVKVVPEPAPKMAVADPLMSTIEKSFGMPFFSFSTCRCSNG